MAPLIDVQDLRIRFDVAEAVRGIHFHIDVGEVLGLVGALIGAEKAV
jgi:ABC-type dipeptide/oligopeptide/nickel transport system ATPase component